jgi:predicted nucleic acid-binding Zn ribbon protein
VAEQDEDEVWVRDEDDTLRPSRGPSPVAAVLGDLARQRRWGERLEGAVVFGRWEQLVGPELAERCEPVRLVGGVLVVRAESQAWATQVGYLTGQLVERAAEVLGEGLVREVRIVVGPLSR